MRKFIILLVLVLTAGMASATSGGGQGDFPQPQDDRWPWSWGTECPFPWKSVRGSWIVKSLTETGNFHGHRLEILVEDDPRPGVKILKVNQYDEHGQPVAHGESHTEVSGRVIEAIMSPVQVNKKAYKLYVRAYDKVPMGPYVQAQCANDNQVVAVTFCAFSSQDCKQGSNYILE